MKARSLWADGLRGGQPVSEKRGAHRYWGAESLDSSILK